MALVGRPLLNFKFEKLTHFNSLFAVLTQLESSFFTMFRTHLSSICLPEAGIIDFRDFLWPILVTEVWFM